MAQKIPKTRIISFQFGSIILDHVTPFNIPLRILLGKVYIIQSQFERNFQFISILVGFFFHKNLHFSSFLVLKKSLY
jgi:hypothetical protein